MCNTSLLRITIPHFFSFKNVGLVSMKTMYLRNRRYLQNSNTVKSTFVLETKLRTLAEQKVLLPTEPSLQSLYHNFKLQAKNLNMLIYLLPIPVSFISDFRLSYICHTLGNKYPVIVFFFFPNGTGGCFRNNTSRSESVCR